MKEDQRTSEPYGKGKHNDRKNDWVGQGEENEGERRKIEGENGEQKQVEARDHRGDDEYRKLLNTDANYSVKKGDGKPSRRGTS